MAVMIQKGHIGADQDSVEEIGIIACSSLKLLRCQILKAVSSHTHAMSRLTTRRCTSDVKMELADL